MSNIMFSLGSSKILKICLIPFRSSFSLSAHHGEVMDRDFGVFVGSYFICASHTQISYNDISMENVVQSNETLGTAYRRGPDNMTLENYTFYSIDHKSKCRGMVDEIKFKFDRIILYNNQGVTVIGNNVGILCLHQQQIHLFRISSDGNFVKLTQIGITLFPNDMDLLHQHPQFTDGSHVRLPPFTSFKQRLMTFFYKTLSRSTFYTRFNYLKCLKIWRCHYIDDCHLLIKLANERTIMELDIVDPNTRNQLPSQVAFFVLYSIDKGEILAISENSSANLCDVMINFQHYIEFSSHPDPTNGWQLCSIQSKASRERFRNQVETAKFGSPEEAIKRILWQLPPPAQGNSVSVSFRTFISAHGCKIFRKIWKSSKQYILALFKETHIFLWW